jgi:hypothetical protein
VQEIVIQLFRSISINYTISQKRFYKRLFTNNLIFEIVNMIESGKTVGIERIPLRLSVTLLLKEERVYNVTAVVVGI